MTLAAAPASPRGSQPTLVFDLLHLEDSPADAELIAERLRMDGLAPRITRVDTRAAFTAALRGGAYVLILADLALPDFDGMSALSIACEAAPSVPFIFVSGTLGEEAAIEAVRSGATDYVVKQRLARLPVVVRRALAEAGEKKDRRAAEVALRGSEARLARLLGTTPAGIVELDAAGRFTYLNDAAARMLGASPGALLATRYDDPAWRPQQDDGTAIPLSELPGARALRGETVMDFEHTICARDGMRRVLLADVVPMWDEAGRVEGAMLAFQDITVRQAQAVALRESEARMRLLLDSMSEGFYAIDQAGRATLCNAAFLRMLGFAGEHEVLGHVLHNIVHHSHPDGEPYLKEECPIHRTAQTGVPAHVTGEVFHRRDGTSFPVEYWVQPVLHDGVLQGAVCSFVDVTERVRMEAALRELNETLEERVRERTGALQAAEDNLRQAQKMEAVGQLTGGIAHDFNNLLQGISGTLEIMRRRVDQGRAEEAAGLVDTARRTVERAASLTHRLLAFGRRQALLPRAVELDGLVNGMAELIRRTMGPTINLKIRKTSGTRRVCCDPNQLENVLLNLSINARDAMPEGGHLTIQTRDVTLSEADLAGADDGAKPGDYVEISVSDTGTGMSPEVLERAFEPFFTTKPVGQGTGLGLSQAYGFARQSDGFMRLESRPGEGTVVRMFLRQLHGSPESAPDAGEMPRTPGAPRSGQGGTLLLVEDETHVRRVAAETLRDMGFLVLEAGDGESALRLLRSPSVKVDLVVTDIGLPNGMNGRQMADTLREKRPTLPVLFITGYAGSALDKPLSPGMEMISKPFTLDALAARVQDMLNRREAA